MTRLRTAELQQLRKSAKTAQEKLMKAGTPRDKADAPNQTAAQGAKDWSEMLQRDARKQAPGRSLDSTRCLYHNCDNCKLQTGQILMRLAHNRGQHSCCFNIVRRTTRPLALLLCFAVRQ